MPGQEDFLYIEFILHSSYHIVKKALCHTHDVIVDTDTGIFPL